MIQKYKFRKFRAVLALFSAVLLTAASETPRVLASVPSTMSYQGILKDSSSNYLTGTYSMTFKLYNVSTGGTALWSETQSSVSVSSGKFSVTLGSTTPIALAFSADYWLGITVGADAEMTPRVKLASAGYAYMAENVANGFTQAQHDALSHKNIEGVRDNTELIAKLNFKLDAYTQASSSNMGDMVVDTFNDASGIDAAASTAQVWRGSPNYDVIRSTGGIDSNSVLALHANGTNGSTTFTDSSSSAKSMTAVGNAQISTAQSKFSGASALFDGSGDYVTSPDHNDFNFAAGDFTIDMWVRFTSVSGDKALVCQSENGLAGGWGIYIDNGYNFRFDINGSESPLTYSWSPAINAWYHVAVVRSGNTWLLFIDGVQKQSATSSSTINDTTSTLKVGRAYTYSYGSWLGSEIGEMAGYIDELRISKGIARWTSNFTPPSSEYAVASGSANVISTAYAESSAPSEALIIPSETLNTGTITYYVSRDNGTTWTTAPKSTVVSLSTQPSGTQLKWKAVITGDAELDAIAVGI